MRLVAAYATRAGLVLAQSGGRRGEQEAELQVAPGILAVLPLQGRWGTGDAWYCQR